MIPATVPWLDTDSSTESQGDLPDFGGQCDQHKVQDVPKGVFIQGLEATAVKDVAIRIEYLPCTHTQGANLWL